MFMRSLLDIVSGPAGAVVLGLVLGLLFLWIVAWIFLPFIVGAIRKDLDKHFNALRDQHERTNTLLTEVRDAMSALNETIQIRAKSRPAA